MKKMLWLLLTMVSNSVFTYAQQYPIVLSEKQRALVIDDLLEDRFNTVLPEIMRKEGVDMWIITSREYNEDPVMRTMLPAVWLSARRRTIFVFFDNGTQIERFAIARYDVGKLLKGEWDLNLYPNQFEALARTIEKKNPKKIALNYSKNYAHADGISKTEYEELFKSLKKEHQAKVVSAENLAVAWLETRTPKEMVIFEQLGKISHQIINEAFSLKVIQPGVTTTDDVVWWMRQKVTDLGLETWFHPTVDVQRADNKTFDHLKTFSKVDASEIIMPGDLVHCDFGISYLRLNTDHQQIGYVLKPGETEIPEYLSEAYKKGNRLQEILTDNFKQGLTGNEILANALSQSQKEGIRGTIYTHPIGAHGHAAGPTIGMWDNQGKTVGPGDYPLYANTAYSIELNAAVEVPQWGKTIRIMLEENGLFDGKSFRYIDGRQKEILKIPRN
jgi:Xaa-Pro aminopeptidase